MDKPTTILGRIISLMEENLPGISEEYEINAESHLRNDLSLDSLDDVELLMKVERDFEITISDADANDITTVGDLIRCVEKELAKKTK